jgi:hypothetical protein
MRQGHGRLDPFLIALSLLVTSAVAPAPGEVVDLDFGPLPVADAGTPGPSLSVVKVRGAGGPCQDALYLLTVRGELEDLFRQENRRAIDHPMIEETWRFCSAFSTHAGDDVLVGRNWDNQNVGSVIVSYCRAPGRHASISFCRAIDLGYPLNLDLEQLASTELGERLQLAPFYAMDGINEHGLAVAVTGVAQTTHEARDDGPLIFVTYLVRKILDRARDVDEAVELAESHIPFDLDRNSLNAHFLIADSAGRSVILEHDQERWRAVRGDGAWQALTNKPVHGVPDASLRERCWRYRSIAGSLEGWDEAGDWRTAMRVLRDVKQDGTTWSVVYSPVSRQVHCAVYQDWDTVYRLDALAAGGSERATAR